MEQLPYNTLSPGEVAHCQTGIGVVVVTNELLLFVDNNNNTNRNGRVTKGYKTPFRASHSKLFNNPLVLYYNIHIHRNYFRSRVTFTCFQMLLCYRCMRYKCTVRNNQTA